MYNNKQEGVSNMPKGIYIRTPEARLNIGKAAKGRKITWGSKISKTLLGRYTGYLNPNWKGNDIKYNGLHAWVRQHLGKPSKCEHCETTEKHMYHWANISGGYKRDLTDWVRLCVSCHKKYDLGKITL